MSGHGAILGVSADFHDAAACVLLDGRVVAAAEEERFTRRKHDPQLPEHALRWCAASVGLRPSDVRAVVFYEKPLDAFERVVAAHGRAGPRRFPSLVAAAGAWSRRKHWIALRLERACEAAGLGRPPVLFSEHHLSHAAAAYYPSPFPRAATITLDGVGEWASSSIGRGRGSSLTLLQEQRYPHSLGLLYSTLTAHCGFAVNDGEYKLMGLAPYGTPRYLDVLRARVVHVFDDGAIELDPRYFDLTSRRRMSTRALDPLLDGPPAPLGADPGPREADIAASAQALLEEVVLKVARHARTLTGEDAVCLAGGVALNCVAMERLRVDGPFADVWVQPAAGDAGGSVGAALWAWHSVMGEERTVELPDGMRSMALGPSYSGDEIAAWLTERGVEHRRLSDRGALVEEVAASLAGGALVGWLRGPMEFGPRALGHRSILADPRREGVAGDLNRRVKGREGFRPFAPAVLAERAHEWFDISGPSRYMSYTVPVRSAAALPTEAQGSGTFAERLAAVRSDIPACTHVDGTARVQVVDREGSPDFWELLRAFEAATACPVLLNTSFNRAGEPIVRSPAEALASARQAGLDQVVLEDCVVLLRSGGMS